MNIKYSILMPYYKRYSQFKITLMTYQHFCKRNDIEFIIIEDIKNINDKEEHEKLLSLVSKYSSVFKFKHLYSEFETFNPAKLFNMGAKQASGNYFVLTNPEIAILNNVIEIADGLVGDCYIVGSCCSGIKCKTDVELLGDFEYEPHMFYQHSVQFNRMLHFFSIISSSDFFRIGMFDEGYSDGIGYEDDDFRDTVLKNNIRVVANDDIRTLHIEHDRNYQQDMTKTELNKLYYYNKWNRR